MFPISDPTFEDLDFDEAEQRAERYRTLSKFVGRQMGQNLANIMEVYPDLNPDIAVGATFAGIPADHPLLQDIAFAQARHDEGENVFWKGLKTNVRAGLNALELIPNMVARLARTGVYAFGGSDEFSFMLPWDAFNLAGPGDSEFALYEFLSGRPVEQGTGFIPAGTPVTERVNYRNFLAAGMTPEQAAEASVEESGVPVRETAEMLRAKGNIRGIGGASPGQLFVLGVGWAPGPLYVEPGSREFQLVSGMADVAYRLSSFELTNPIINTFVNEARAVRAFQGIDHLKPTRFNDGLRLDELGRKRSVADPTAGSRRVADPFGIGADVGFDPRAGALRGPRETVHGETFREWSKTRKAQEFAQAAASNQNFYTTYRMWRGKSKTATDMGFLRRMTDEADTPEKVFALMEEGIQLGINKKPVKSSLISNIAERGLSGRVSDKVGNVKAPGVLERASRGELGPIARALSPARTVSSRLGGMAGSMGAQNADEALVGRAIGEFGGLRSGLRHSVDESNWGHLFQEMPGRGINTRNLAEGLEDLEGFLSANGFSVAERSEFMKRWSNLADDATQDEGYAILRDSLIVLEQKMIARGIDANIAGHVTRVFDDLDDMRIYFGEQLYGDPAFFMGTEFKNGRPKATAHELTEYMSGHIPLPDARAMRRAMSRTRRITGTFTTNLKRARHRVKGTALRTKGDPLKEGSVSFTRSGPNVEVVRADGEKILMTFDDFEARYTTTEITSKNAFVPVDVAEGQKIDHLNARTSTLMMDFYMQKFWKPATLLRLAWPVRVIGEEQLRLAAAGLDAMFNHPIQYIGWTLGEDGMRRVNKMLDTVSGGRVRMNRVGQGDLWTGSDEELARLFGMDEIDQAELALSEAGKHQDAMSSRDANMMQRHGKGGGGSTAWVRTNTETQSGRVALFGEIRQMSRETQIVARVARDGVEATLRWIQGTKAGQRAIKRLAATPGRSGAKRAYVSDEVAQAFNLDDAEEAIVMYLDSVNARIHGKTGGEVVLIGPDGVRVDREALFDVENLKGYKYEVLREGNTELIETIGNGRWRGHNVREPKNLRNWRKMSNEFEQFIDASDMPVITTKTPKDLADGLGSSRWDQFVDDMFHTLMARPTNFLSRSPAFKQHYWATVEDAIQFTDEKSAASLIASARANNLPDMTISRMIQRRQDILNTPMRSADGVIHQRRIMTQRLVQADDTTLAQLIFNQPGFEGQKDFWTIVNDDTLDAARIAEVTDLYPEAMISLGILLRRTNGDRGALARILDSAVNGSDDLAQMKSAIAYNFSRNSGISETIWDYVPKEIATAKTVEELGRHIDEGIRKVDVDIMELLRNLEADVQSRIGINLDGQYLEEMLGLNIGSDSVEIYRWINAVTDEIAGATDVGPLWLLDLIDKVDNRAQLGAVRQFDIPISRNRPTFAWSDAVNSGADENFLASLVDWQASMNEAGQALRVGQPQDLDDFLETWWSFPDNAKPKGLSTAETAVWQRQELARWLKSVEQYLDLEGFGAIDRAFDSLVRQLEEAGIDFNTFEALPFGQARPDVAPIGARPPAATPKPTGRPPTRPDATFGRPIGDRPGKKPTYNRPKQSADDFDSRLPPGFFRREANRQMSNTMAESFVSNQDILPSWVDDMVDAVEDGVPDQHIFDYFSDDPSRTYMSLEDIDDYSKAAALNGTKDLLYDLSKRHQITDMLRHVFPFGEAWLEILGTWTKLMMDNPTILRRGAQGTTGAKEAGIITVDPNTGEEYFNYPGGGLLANWMMEGNPLKQNESAVGIQLRGRVQGLNLIAGQYIPGFGPAVQIPVSYFKNPRFDQLKEWVLPFGEQRVDSFADVADSIVPPYFRRVLQAIGAREPEMQRLHNNLVIDIMRGWISDGTMENTEDAWADSWDRANELAGKFSLIRGLAQFGLPTGPEMVFTLEDTEGKMWLYQSLAQKYTQLIREEHDGDELAAWAEFKQLFGTDPFQFATPKTVQIEPRHTTQVGDRWFRANSELFEPGRFALTAYYAQPDDPEEDFDYTAYLRSIADEARKPVNPEQWTRMWNDTLGRITYDRIKQDAEIKYGESNTELKRAWLKTARNILIDFYPGYARPIPGLPKRPSIAMKIEELERWEGEPRLNESEAGQGLRLYWQLRERAKDLTEAAGYDRESLGRDVDRLQPIREWLRNAAMIIVRDNNDFGHLWAGVLQFELHVDGQPDTLPSGSDTLGQTP